MVNEKDWMNALKQGKRNPFSDQDEERKGYEKKEEEVSSPIIDGDSYLMMMDPAERQRAQTFYENMRREKEDSCCKFCDKVITQDEMSEQKVTMLQSTECWH